MTTVRDTLYVHGNIPCPTPTHSSPPSHHGGETHKEHKITQAIRSCSKHDQPVNTEEELRKILLQAKDPTLHGPTTVAKRSEYFKKIKTLNDGMYNQYCPDEFRAKSVDSFVLHGRKMDKSATDGDLNGKESNQQLFPGYNEQSNNVGNISPTCMASPAMPVRSKRSSTITKSAKSFQSTYTSASDPPPRPPPRSITLPQLTIGASESKTRGEYIQEDDSVSLVIGNASGNRINESLDTENMRFPSPSPRRHTRLMDRSPRRDVTGNYGSMTMNDLKACLHINKPSHLKSEHEEYLIQDYLKNFKQVQEHVNKQMEDSTQNAMSPYKVMTNTRRNLPRRSNTAGQPHSHRLPPKYEFKTVDSYLKFNKRQETSFKNLEELRMHKCTQILYC